MKLEVCLSCMGEKDLSIIEKTGIQTDALVISQCDEEGFVQECTPKGVHRLLMTQQRGLSNSRNMSLDNAKGDILLLCDDDEKLFPFHVWTILSAYERLDADIICFRFANQPSRLAQREQRLNKWTCLRIASWQITMRKDAIKQANVRFDPRMGAGSGNGAGEEVQFLRDCLSAGLKAWYVPEDIGTVGNSYYDTGEAEGTWFNGFDEKFFYQRGVSTRHTLGLVPSIAYAAYYALAKRKMYAKEMNPVQAFAHTLKGIVANDIDRQEV